MILSHQKLAFNNFGNLLLNFKYPSIQLLIRTTFESLILLHIWTYQFRYVIVEIYCFKAIFTKKQSIFYLLTGATICKQKTFLMDFLFSVIYNICESNKLEYCQWFKMRKTLFILLFREFYRHSEFTPEYSA